MKPRRDITLGEMQDECKKRETRCGLDSDNPCPYDKICDAISPNGFSTDGNGGCAVFACHWNLTDPPRFNEAQMALLKALRGMGARYIGRRNGELSVFGERSVHIPITKLLGIDDEDCDLAELLGKESNEK